MRRPIIAANWKLHKTIAEARQFVNACTTTVQTLERWTWSWRRPLRRSPPCTTVCVPHRTSWQPRTSFGKTVGPIPAKCRHRSWWTLAVPTSSLVTRSGGSISVKPMRRSAKRWQRPSALAYTPLYVGESLAQRQAGETFAVVERQIRQGLATCDTSAMAHLVFAYEPSGPLVLA